MYIVDSSDSADCTVYGGDPTVSSIIFSKSIDNGVSNGLSSGSWAAAGGVGTFSGVNPDDYREDGSIIRQIYNMPGLID